MLNVVKSMLFLGMLVFFFVGKLSAIRAERLFPNDWSMQEKENHSLGYGMIGVICMFGYFIIAYILPFLRWMHVPFVHALFNYKDIPLTFFGAAIIFLILELPKWYKGLKLASISLILSLITVYIATRIV